MNKCMSVHIRYMVVVLAYMPTYLHAFKKTLGRYVVSLNLIGGSNHPNTVPDLRQGRPVEA